MNPSPSLTRYARVDDWLAIEPGERVLVRTGKVDIGQRISTAIALIAAEELDVDVERIEVAPAQTGRAPDEGYTSGSNSIQESGLAVRQAAATAKRHLLERAAQALGVDIDRLEVSDGLVRASDANASISYWELMQGQAFAIPVNAGLPTKSPDSYRHVGQAAAPRGFVDLVTGKTRFVQDLQLEGMLHARVIRPPHYHARLQSLDESIQDQLGQDQLGQARLIRDGSFLAVAAPDEYVAVRAAARIAKAATWAPVSGLDTRDIYTALRTNRRTSLPVVNGTPANQPVPPTSDLHPDARTTLEASYERPYQMHASLAPSAAVALYEPDRLTVWSHTQGIYPLRGSLAET
ncbi:MAG: molybdopterin cofactor-binding domain-containing protein, partial [Gammaproteobacteria bacterium]